ncbi:hypothetical protein [Nocardia implantans]|uniref:Ig-like domain-containing protein n=1 Tax=Nocardia implantans TaxID=3108168 RepID=A0ABU6B520_9NOCA|nr:MULTISPECIES: hypothetical protein [unclassified Nocardia]MBF6196177.1 hypothetical protein [Nocardia beijingensis]MEA3532815.1 hypothetical protein [Nocardia sp. CDC192]MEB3514687.1 hypothetical protein [Nocardia sp. CDC186]
MFARYRLAGVVVLASVSLGVVAFAAPGVAAPPSSATAAAVITCTEQGTVHWAGSGLGAIPSRIEWTATTRFTDCMGSAVDEGKPYPVSMDEQGFEVASCDGKVSVHQGTGTITWSDGSTSTISSAAAGNQSKSKGSGPALFPIVITSGTYAGHTASDDNTVSTAQSCPGVTEAKLTGTFTVD